MTTVLDYLVGSLIELQAYTVFWDGSKGSYFIRTPAGLQRLPEKTVRELGEQYIENKMAVSIKSATAKLQSKAISLAEWEDLMYRDLKDAHVVMLQLGRGGQTATTFSDYGRIGYKLRNEKDFLTNFALQIADGKVSGKQLDYRVQLYINGAMTSYHKGHTSAMAAADYQWEMRVLNPAEHCDDCIEYANMGWQPIGTLPEPGEASRCRHNCQCDKVFAKELESGEA